MTFCYHHSQLVVFVYFCSVVIVKLIGNTSLVRHSYSLVRHPYCLVRHSYSLVRHSYCLVRHSYSLVRHSYCTPIVWFVTPIVWFVTPILLVILFTILCLFPTLCLYLRNNDVHVIIDDVCVCHLGSGVFYILIFMFCYTTISRHDTLWYIVVSLCAFVAQI